VKVAHIVAAPLNSGAGLGALVLAHGLRAHGAQSVFVGRVEPSCDDEFPCHPLPVTERIKVGLQQQLQQRLHEWRFGKSEALFGTIGSGLSPHRHPTVGEADIVVVQWSHASTLGPAFWRWLERDGSRVVIMLRDMWPFTGGCHFSGHCLGYQTGCLTCPLLGLRTQTLTFAQVELKRKALKGVGAVVAISEDIAHRARSSVVFRNTPIRVIQNAIDTMTFCPMDKSTARALLGLPQGAKIIAFGALNLSDERKGGKIIQRIAARIDSTEGLRWASFGSNPLPMPSATTAFGLVDDRARLNAIYAAADIFLMPSQQESFGKVTAEALSSGTPVIAFRDTPAEEIVTDRCGWLVPLGDVAAMQGALEYALTKPRHELATMGLAGREHVLAHFSPENVAAQHMELYRSLLLGALHSRGS
jgi:glycosyltransferase involved in cell wall biosynthesis